MRLRRVVVVALVVGVCAGVAVVVSRGEGEPPIELGLLDGAAWVASTATSELTLIDGQSADVAAHVRLEGEVGDLAAVQAGQTGYAVDRRSGAVTRVDPKLLTADETVPVIEGASGEVSAFATTEALYVLDAGRGIVAVTDPDDVHQAIGRPLSLAERVASSVVDDDGRLWALGAVSGDLVRFDLDDRRTQSRATRDPDGAGLLTVDGRAALVDRATRRVATLSPDGDVADEACVEMEPRDDTVVVGGSPRSPRVYVISGAQGVLRLSDLATGRCDGEPIRVSDIDHQLGDPQESGGRVFVPDYTAGRVIIVDVESGDVQTTEELVPPGTVFDLFAEDGVVFYNDPGSEHAGVVRTDGSYTAVSKYNPADSDPAPETQPNAPTGGPDSQSAEPDPIAASEPPPELDVPSLPAGTASADVPSEVVSRAPGRADGASRPRSTRRASESSSPRDPTSDDEDETPAVSVDLDVSVISFGSDIYTLGDAVHFTAHVTGRFEACEWQMDGESVDCDRRSGGDTSVSGTMNPTSAGQQTVSLTVTGGNGRIVTKTGNVTIVAPLTPPGVLSVYAVTPGPYTAGEPIDVAADVTPEFTSCTFTIGSESSPCLPAASDSATTVRSTITPTDSGSATLAVTLDGPAGMATESTILTIDAPVDSSPPILTELSVTLTRISSTDVRVDIRIVAEDPESDFVDLTDDGSGRDVTENWTCTRFSAPPNVSWLGLTLEELKTHEPHKVTFTNFYFLSCGEEGDMIDCEYHASPVMAVNEAGLVANGSLDAVCPPA